MQNRTSYAVRRNIMEQREEITLMLNQIPNPAFLVKDGSVLEVNPSAEVQMITVGAAVQTLLATGAQEYTDYTDGNLFLTLRICGNLYNASVSKVGSCDLFVLDQEDDIAELQSMALAAQELRSPLAGVMSVADSLFPLIEDSKDADSQKKIAQLNRGLFQMLRIISNMSDAYRYDREQHPRLETRDICGILDSLFSACIPLVEYTGLKLRFTGLSERIYCLVDEEKLERGIHNIISNALKFTPPGGTIDAQLVRKKNMLHLIIQNTGCDVPNRFPENAHNLYQRMPGLEDSRFGIGLGMVLIRGAAAAHGGTLLLSKTGENGTRIVFTIAIRQSSDPNVRTSIFQVDYAGERDHRLLEFSDSLPVECYRKENIN